MFMLYAGQEAIATRRGVRGMVGVLPVVVGERGPPVGITTSH